LQKNRLEDDIRNANNYNIPHFSGMKFYFRKLSDTTRHRSLSFALQNGKTFYAITTRVANPQALYILLRHSKREFTHEKKRTFDPIDLSQGKISGGSKGEEKKLLIFLWNGKRINFFQNHDLTFQDDGEP